jgi:hypothetical protein
MIMCDQVLAAREKDLREAVASERYDEVEACVEAFCKAALVCMESLPPGHPEWAMLASRAAERLQWALTMLRIARSTCLEELRTAVTLEGFMRQLESTRPDSRTLSLNL